MRPEGRPPGDETAELCDVPIAASTLVSANMGAARPTRSKRDVLIAPHPHKTADTRDVPTALGDPIAGLEQASEPRAPQRTPAPYRTARAPSYAAWRTRRAARAWCGCSTGASTMPMSLRSRAASASSAERGRAGTDECRVPLGRSLTAVPAPPLPARPLQAFSLSATEKTGRSEPRAVPRRGRLSAVGFGGRPPAARCGWITEELWIATKLSGFGWLWHVCWAALPLSAFGWRNIRATLGCRRRSTRIRPERPLRLLRSHAPSRNRWTLTRLAPACSLHGIECDDCRPLRRRGNTSLVHRFRTRTSRWSRQDRSCLPSRTTRCRRRSQRQPRLHRQPPIRRGGLCSSHRQLIFPEPCPSAPL